MALRVHIADSVLEGNGDGRGKGSEASPSIVVQVGSFHLRSMARSGLIKETDDVKGRLALKLSGLNWPDLPSEDRAVAKEIAEAETRDVVDAILQFQNSSESYPDGWQRPSSGVATSTQLTTIELSGISQQLRKILNPYRRRPSPPDAAPINFFAWAFPIAVSENRKKARTRA